MIKVQQIIHVIDKKDNQIIKSNYLGGILIEYFMKNHEKYPVDILKFNNDKTITINSKYLIKTDLIECSNQD